MSDHLLRAKFTLTVRDHLLRGWLPTTADRAVDRPRPVPAAGLHPTPAAPDRAATCVHTLKTGSVSSGERPPDLTDR